MTDRYQILIVKPPEYIHSECFREVAETLMYGLRKLGHIAEIGVNVSHPRAQHIMLGGHLLGPQDLRLIPPDWILYNLEQLGEHGAQFLTPAYHELAKSLQVWDYSPLNVAEWAKLGVPAKLVPIGYVPELHKVKKAEVQDIDVLFMGCINERRQKIIVDLRNAGLKVATLSGEYGRHREEIMARTKIGLNVHYYEAKVFEMTRASYFMANEIAVVTELSPDIPDELAEGLRMTSYRFLVPACMQLAHDHARRNELAKRGFDLFSARKEEDILKSVLEVPAVA